MPFKSEKQRRYMWANRPGIAKRWEAEAAKDPRKLRKLRKVKIRPKRRKP